MKKGLAVKRLFQASPKSLLVNLCGWSALMVLLIFEVSFNQFLCAVGRMMTSLIDTSSG